MSEWRELRLGDLGKVVTGKTPSKKNPEDWGDEMPFVTPTDYKNYRKWADSTERALSHFGIERLNKKILPPNSIMVTCIGSDMGKVAVNPVPVVTNQQINSIVPDTKLVTNDFLYYRLVSMYEILRIYGGDGTAVPIINKSDFEGLETEIPPLPEQKAITAVLSSLDDKIDLLHRQNKTLESLAQTLFRHWFIDNAQDDWEVRKLKEVCEIKNGYAFKSETYQDDGYKIIRTLNFENNLVTLNKLTFISQELAKDYEKYNLERFDFLLVMVGASLGNFAIVTKDILPALQNQNMWCFRAKKSISQHYLNFALRDIITENLHSASGSARQFFQKSAFYEFEIVVPPAELIQKFTQSAEGIFSKIELNQHQIRTLEKLRDTLLPKLMSGEVRVRL